MGVTSDGSFGFSVKATIKEVLAHFPAAALVLVDIPVGLPDRLGTPRMCDRLARRAIGPRRSSVFPTPCREALSAPSYARATAINRATLGCGLSRQSWALAPRIADVDRYLKASTSGPRVREMHPEVCFWALNGGRHLQHHKAKPEGERQRRAILRHYAGRLATLVDAIAKAHPYVETHDVLDALVGAVTAQGPLQTLPERPTTDAHGLPMEMVYRAEQPFDVPLGRRARRKRGAR